MQHGDFEGRDFRERGNAISNATITDSLSGELVGTADSGTVTVEADGTTVWLTTSDTLEYRMYYDVAAGGQTWPRLEWVGNVNGKAILTDVPTRV